MSDDQIADLLIEQSIGVSAEFSSLQLKSDGGVGRTDAEENAYIYSRFVGYLGRNHPDAVSDLGTVRNASILAEIILHLQDPNPTAVGASRSQPAVGTSHCVLSALGVTGRASKQYTRELISVAKAAGAGVCVLDIHVKEAAFAPSSFLGRDAGRRYGPTEEAIKRDEVTIDYVKVTELAIRENSRSWNSHTGDERYSDRIRKARDANEEGLQTEIYALLVGSYSNMIALDRDIDAILFAHASRKNRTDDFFAAEHVFVTRNPLLYLTADNFARRYLGYRPGEIGTTISAQHLAGILRLAAGPAERAEISRKQLLANCTELATTNSGVVEGIIRNVRELGYEDAENLEIILSSPRYRQIAADATLNNVERVTPNLTKEVVGRIFAEFDAQAEGRVTERHREERNRLVGRLTGLARELEEQRRRNRVLIAKQRAQALVALNGLAWRWRRRSLLWQAVMAVALITLPLSPCLPSSESGRPTGATQASRRTMQF